jgi:CHAT domain-containing protein
MVTEGFEQKLIRSIFFRRFFISTFVIVALLACAGKEMSVEEAKKVTVSMAKETFVPPPRRIDDILAILDQPGQFDPEIVTKFKAQADALPPDTDNPVTLAMFYRKRGLMAFELGRPKQALEDIRVALGYAENKEGQKVPGLNIIDYSKILTNLALAEDLFGNFSRAIELEKRVLKIAPNHLAYRYLTRNYLQMGNLKAAEKVEKAGVHYCDEQIYRKSGTSRVKYLDRKHMIQAISLDIRGKHAEAEPLRRSIVKNMVHYYLKTSPVTYFNERRRLATNLIMQGRLVEAEYEVREILRQSMGLGGKKSSMTANHLRTFARVLLAQGRVQDAETITKVTIHIMKASGLSDNSFFMARIKMYLGNVLVVRRNYTKAMKLFDKIRENLSDNQYLYKKLFAGNPGVLISLLKTGRTEEAMRIIAAKYNNFRKNYGEKHRRTAEVLAMRAMAYAKLGEKKQAMKDFSECIPILLEKKEPFGHDYLIDQRFQILVEAYIDLLTQVHEEKLEKEFEFNTSAEIFKLFQAITGSIVQKALGESGARAAAVNPDLADLVRREQDASKQLKALRIILSNVLAMPPDQQNPDTFKDLQTRIEALNSARTTLINEIKIRFPRYTDFTNPQPVTLSQLQNHLRPDEVLISIYTASNQTYVWAIPHNGKVRFSTVDLGKKQLRQIVAKLRRALDPEPTVFGDIPEFDLTQAYNLYAELLKPVEKDWKNTTDLLIVAHGPLGQLPFSALPTAPMRLGQDKGVLFDNYRKVPWLIRKVSITRLPSASSFITLRTLPEANPSRKAFIGFGDPFFNPEQLARAKTGRTPLKDNLASQETKLHVRGIRITETGNLDSEKITSCHLDSLNRLPDTAEEIKSIAQALDADLATDIFTGEKASERQVKTMDLSDWRVIAFATHALLPGDLDGLDQPALALCSPAVTGDDEDGLLTMGEIMKLRMNADWVVLSACNTGAADGAGAEAVSGLGRAFFYAGTRAILVSMWPVETTSARKLTSDLFRFQKEDINLSRARALRKSMLELIDAPGFEDQATGKIVASYAHPLFWAPFMIVGESGHYFY